MRQSSQIEKPRNSATTDQMRLRRAMYLPVDSQNFSFSGFQSEIQARFRLLISTFLCGRNWSPRCVEVSPSQARSCHEPLLGLHSVILTHLGFILREVVLDQKREHGQAQRRQRDQQTDRRVVEV